MNALKDRYRTMLARRSRKRIEDRTRVPAAVLLLLYEKDEEPYILLTKRTNHVTSHKGQISLPGGSREMEDATLTATALREAYEEVGIRREDVEILGLLDDCLTQTSNFVITPVVGFLTYPPDLAIDPGEVEEAIEVPLSFLQEAFQDRCNELEEGFCARRLEFLFGDYLIWGATAGILEQFLSLDNNVNN